MMPSAISPMFLRALSKASESCPITLTFAGSMLRSASALPTAAGWAPPGIQMRLGILGALHESGDIRIGDREAHRADDLAAGFLEAGMEGAFGVDAGTIVRHHRVGGLHAFLGRPGAECLIELRRGRRGAGDIGRFGGDDRSRRIHHHHEFLGLGGNVGDRERVRRQRKARENVGVIAHDQFLRQPFGEIRRHPADILADEFELLAGDRVAVLLHIELDAVIELNASVGELARIGIDDADLDGVLSKRRTARDGERRRQSRKAAQKFLHRFLPVLSCSGSLTRISSFSLGASATRFAPLAVRGPWPFSARQNRVTRGAEGQALVMNPQANGAETVDPDEVARFSRLAGEWWDPHGPMAALHKFNPVRLAYVRDRTAEHFGRDPKSLASLSGLRFLDIGCGGGILCEPLARLGASVVGADPSATNIGVAQAHAAQSGLAVDYRDTT